MTTLKEEEPYAAAVNNEYISSTCSNCFAWNSKDLVRVKLSRCAGCLVLYYCSAKCQKEDWKNHKPECKLLRSANFVPSMGARMAMRMIEKSKKRPDIKSFNGRTYDSLMHHTAERRQVHYCMIEARMIYSEICRFMGSNAPDFETVFLALSKKAINAFPIDDGSWRFSTRGVGIYLGLSVLDHSCRPDAFIVNQGAKMLLRTTNKDLVYSDKLTISYGQAHSFMETVARRINLLSSYFFFCECEECEDIDSNKKKIAGRPVCCPDSWFYGADRICNNCDQEISSELAAKADDAMERLDGAASVFKERAPEGGDLTALVAEWINLIDSCKEVLTDENIHLFEIMNIIWAAVMLTDAKVACKYIDLCLLQARKQPRCVFIATLFVRRQQIYQMAKKPLQEIKEALNEALDYVQVVFGPQHELTQMLLKKKMLFDFADLNTR